MTQVINLLGGPGSGKSTVAAATFAELKYQQKEVELVTEFAKDLVWERSWSPMENQIYMLGQQYHRLHRLIGKVDFVVTDAPILLQLYYGRNMPASFQQLVLDLYGEMNNHNFFLVRPEQYNPNGRRQNKSEAEEVDKYLCWKMGLHGLPAEHIVTNRDAPQEILKRVLA